GYTADLVAGAWFGNDNGKPMKKVTGGGLPAKLWKDVMLKAHAGMPIRGLPGLSSQGMLSQKIPSKNSREERGFWARLMSGLAGNGG
ncbi:MAG: penicillin-binding protein, partial [Rhodospirillales bacterium]